MKKIREQKRALLHATIGFGIGALLLLANTQHPLFAQHNDDHDGDGIEDALDIDDDRDGNVDCVEKKDYRNNTDNDGVRDKKDTDDDNDGVADWSDMLPLDKNNNGIANDLDRTWPVSKRDDDADGIRDKYEKDKYKLDHDNDEVPDDQDTDDDNDGIVDDQEPTMVRDHDNDSRKDKKESDDDNDGIPDLQETSCANVLSSTIADPAWETERFIGNGGGSIGHGLAVDSQNNLHAVWVGYRGISLMASYSTSTDNGETWSTPVEVSDGSSSSSGVNVGIGPDDAVHIVYLKKFEGGNDVYYRRSEDAGASWSEPVLITDSASNDAATPSLSVDITGRVHIAWHSGNENANDDSEYAQVFYVHSDAEGNNFSTPLQLNTNATGHSAWPRFTLQGDGELVAISWRDNRDGNDWDVYVAVSTDGGDSFTERGAITANKVQWDPDIAVDRNGTLHLAYMVYDTGGIFIDYMRSTDAGVTWTQAVRLTEEFSRFPFWVVHPEIDTLWLFWKDERDRVSDGEVRADVGLKYTSDFGQSWSAFERVTDLGDIEVRFPSPAMGPNGIPVLTWSDERNGNESEEELYFLARNQ